MDKQKIAMELVALAKDLVSADTFKCPECGTKVLEQTGYCVKCKKKVKAGSMELAAKGEVPEAFKKQWEKNKKDDKSDKEKDDDKPDFLKKKESSVASELVRLAKDITAKEEFKVIVEYVSMETEEDSYEGGLIGNGHTVYHKSHFGVFSSVKAAVHAVANELGVPDSEFMVYSGEDGRIRASVPVDENNSYVGDDKSFMDKFKKGEVRAWLADIVMEVMFAKTWSPTDDELVKNSGLKKD